MANEYADDDGADHLEVKRLVERLTGRGHARRTQEYGRPIDIGADVWVGGGTLILAGVRIGSRAIIGAGSVVTRDVPEGVLAAGNPCRVIRDIPEEPA